MNSYVEAYVSPNENFAISIPKYEYAIETFTDSVKVTGRAAEKIKISSELYNFNYDVNGYFSETITCEEFENYEDKLV